MDSTRYHSEIKSILVPVDYSDYSVQACRYAAKIAAKCNGTIHLFHSFYSPAFDLIEISAGLNTQQTLRADVTEKLQQSENEQMLEFIEKLLNFIEFDPIHPKDIKHEVRSGFAREEIVTYSSTLKPDMVVMGTKSNDKKGTSIFGSTSEAAIMKLNIPVLVIPEDYEFIGEQNLRRVVYLTDYDESDFLSIKKLMSFTSLFNMAIHCIHIGDRDDKWEMLKMQGLQEYFQNAYQQSDVECHIIRNDKDIIETIDKYVSDNKINLIAVTHLKRKLLEKIFRPSTTKKIFNYSKKPLMVFHS